MNAMAPTVTVATANLHGGIDAWGRPFDALDALIALRAEVYCLQECWSDEGDAPFASHLASALDAQWRDVPLATGRRAQPHDNPPATWHRRKSFFDGDHGLYLESERALAKNLAASPRYVAGDPGTFSLALVSRHEIIRHEVVYLDKLRRDRVRRALLIVELNVDGHALTVISTHMAHLTHGAPRHFAQLRKVIRSRRDQPLVLGGDMNMWGPGVRPQLPQLRRAVKAKTWPSWGPHSQLDHLLISRDLDVIDAYVSGNVGSDHLPVMAVLELP